MSSVNSCTGHRAPRTPFNVARQFPGAAPLFTGTAMTVFQAGGTLAVQAR